MKLAMFMRRVTVSSLIFFVAAFVGPLISWPLRSLDQGTPKFIRVFVSDLVFLMWPTQSLAVIEASIGTILAAVVSIGANIFLFLIMGFITGFFSNKKKNILIIYSVICVFIILLFLWGSSFYYLYANIFAILFSLILYAIPFWLVAQVFGRDNT